MTVLLELYISLMPVIIAGILNMVWVKTPYLGVINRPIDNHKYFFDGKRIFGDNKTWKGFFGMIVLGIGSTWIWGLLCYLIPFLNAHNYLYRSYDNSISYNLLIGFLLGLSYVLLELPNSFIKRRFDISPGKSGKGIKSIFIFLDQADSLFGCVLVIAMVYRMSFPFYLLYVFIGALTHIIINMLLYVGKLRRNMF